MTTRPIVFVTTGCETFQRWIHEAMGGGGCCVSYWTSLVYVSNTASRPVKWTEDCFLANGPAFSLNPCLALFTLNLLEYYKTASCLVGPRVVRGTRVGAGLAAESHPIQVAVVAYSSIT